MILALAGQKFNYKVGLYLLVFALTPIILA
jgi:hypothetical protein